MIGYFISINLNDWIFYLDKPEWLDILSWQTWMIGYYVFHIFINFNVSSRTPCHSPLTYSIPTADVGCVAWVIRSCSARVSVPGAGTGWSGGGGGSGTAATVWTTSSRPRTRGPAQSSSGSRRPRLEIWEKLGWVNFVSVFYIFYLQYSTTQ